MNVAKAIVTAVKITSHTAETEITVVLRPEDTWVLQKEQGDQCDYGDMSKGESG